MHTVIRHTKTANGFAVVISGYGNAPTVVQEYRQSPELAPQTKLVYENNYSDERDAVAFFDSVWFAQEAGL
jgi:hypothetical protein